MKIKPAFRIICTLIVLILVANPVLAAAGNLFSSSVQLSQQVLINSEQSESDMPCHQDNSHQDNKESSKQVFPDQSQEDCCAEMCLCDDSSCHGFSLLFQATSAAFYLSNLKTQFHIPLYLSLSSEPKPPPPII